MLRRNRRSGEEGQAKPSQRGDWVRTKQLRAAKQMIVILSNWSKAILFIRVASLLFAGQLMEQSWSSYYECVAIPSGLKFRWTLQHGNFCWNSVKYLIWYGRRRWSVSVEREGRSKNNLMWAMCYSAGHKTYFIHVCSRRSELLCTFIT